MLVLSRKVGEQVFVPDLGVTVKVLSVERGRVRLGIVAPADTAVYREEVWQQVRQSPGRVSAPAGR